MGQHIGILWQNFGEVMLQIFRNSLGCLAVPQGNPANSEGSTTMPVHWIHVQGMIL